MYDTLFARQAIYDKDLKLKAYELLFRGDNSNESGVDNDDVAIAKMATSSVITNIFANVGASRVVGRKNIFINFSRECLLEGIPQLLPKRRVVLEILEGMVVDDELIEVITHLKKLGYKIALDDFICDHQTEKLIDLADIIKIDVLNLNEQEIAAQLSDIKGFKGTLLAEKIEDYEQFEIVKGLGFDYFQGFFLGKPMPVKGKRIVGNRANCLQLLAALNNENIHMSEVEKIIVRDPKLSYRILMVVNSAAHYLVRKITSLREAITLLGFAAVKHWVMLITLEKLSDSSQEIIDRTLVRAKMCELIASKLTCNCTEGAFILGLLSTLDLLLNEPMESILEKIPLSDDIAGALLHREGELGQIIDNIIAYENGCFEQLDYHGLTKNDYVEAYMKSLDYANVTLKRIQ